MNKKQSVSEFLLVSFFGREMKFDAVAFSFYPLLYKDHTSSFFPLLYKPVFMATSLPHLSW